MTSGVQGAREVRGETVGVPTRPEGVIDERHPE
jgi:hypothetical protein